MSYFPTLATLISASHKYAHISYRSAPVVALLDIMLSLTTVLTKYHRNLGKAKSDSVWYFLVVHFVAGVCKSCGIGEYDNAQWVWGH